MPNQRRPGLARVEFYTLARFKAEFVAATVRNGETVTGALIRLMEDYTAQDAERAGHVPPPRSGPHLHGRADGHLRRVPNGGEGMTGARSVPSHAVRCENCYHLMLLRRGHMHWEGDYEISEYGYECLNSCQMSATVTYRQFAADKAETPQQRIDSSHT